MVVNNELVEESLEYPGKGVALTERGEELEKLDEISVYCKEIGDKICYDADQLWALEVEPGVQLWELVYGVKRAVNEEKRRFIQEMVDKNWRSKDETVHADETIYCSLGETAGAASDLKAYIEMRQKILRTMQKPEEYVQFMRTCFPNSVFAEGCNEEFLHIKDFAVHMGEITECLKVLDEEAVGLYEAHHKDIKRAMDYLTIKLCTCAPDSGHEDKLIFEFRYEAEQDGEITETSKNVICSPHLKLVRDDSDLRIYFFWKDDEIEDGRKVLIGRVGRHPWSKYERK